MIIWTHSFEVISPMYSFPLPFRIEREVQYDPRYCSEGKQRRKEQHCVFVYTIAGQGAFRYRDICFNLKPDSVFLCHVGDPNIAYYYPADGHDAWEFVWIGFAGTSAVEVVKKFTSRHGHIFQIMHNSSFVKKLNAFHVPGEHKITITNCEGSILFYELLRLLESAVLSESMNKPAANVLNCIKKYVDERIGQSITVTELARHFAMSREHLTRIFKAQYGVPLHAYILREKLRVGCHLLGTTDLSVKEIGHQLGFTNQTNFNRVFKRILHSTPVEFKRRGSHL